MRSVVALSQVLGGGELQVTPAQGSPAHTPPLQPKAQLVSDEA